MLNSIPIKNIRYRVRKYPIKIPEPIYRVRTRDKDLILFFNNFIWNQHIKWSFLTYRLWKSEKISLSPFWDPTNHRTFFRVLTFFVISYECNVIIASNLEHK